MALQRVRENHNGPKRGRGAWMRKREAKKAARKARRQHDVIIKRGFLNGD